MFKKVASLVGAGALLLSVSGVAFARGVKGPVFPFQPQPTTKNVAIIKGNDVTAVADTGNNQQGNLVGGVMFSTVGVGGAQTQVTGDAGASATQVVVANTQVGCNNCSYSGSEDLAVVRRNDVTAQAVTGYNLQSNSASNVVWGGVGVGGAQTQVTGDAGASATQVVVVNTQLSWGGLW
jgi:hypothetical protein